jgi:hypothetical protein
VSDHLWWYIARASGLVAWALLTASMLWGFLTATKILGKRPRPAWVLDLHRFFGGLAVVFVGVHLAGLLLDSYVEFTWPDLFVPFVSDWRPLALAWGITAFYLLLAVEITSLLKKRLPLRLWRYVHWTSYAVFGLATVHSFTAGTDTRNALVLIALAVGVAEVVFLLIVRLTVRDTGAITPFGSGPREVPRVGSAASPDAARVLSASAPPAAPPPVRTTSPPGRT